MPQILQGKVCAITGGATGIGRAIALSAEEGASVAVNHLGDPDSIEHVKSLRQQIAAVSGTPDSFIDCAGDISRSEAANAFIDRAFQHFGRLDVVVANAGIAKFHDFLSTPDDYIQDHLRVNVQGCYFTTRAAGQVMRRQGTGGSIIGIASISALCGSGELVHYTPTKAAVLNTMQSAAVALGPYGIRCNALLPGTIETQLNVDDLVRPQKRNAVIERTALKRIGKPEDVAGPAVFLASDMSSYCSGAQILVDGGLFINQQ